MSIDARVDYVHHKEDGSGTIHLIDRPPDGCAGRRTLHYDTAPEEVTALNGLDVWGGDMQLMLGDTQIAERVAYGRIKFLARETFLDAVAKYHQRRREGEASHA